MASTHFDVQIKLLMIGDSGVGKTSLLMRFANETYSPTFLTTIGIDFKIKNMLIDSRMVKLQLWDTAGQERFRTITTSYFRGAHGIMLVYDVTKRDSFENVQNWITQIEQHADIHVVTSLVANKCDAHPSQVEVSESEGQAFADTHGMGFMQVSAKEDVNVKNAFVSLAERVLKQP